MDNWRTTLTGNVPNHPVTSSPGIIPTGSFHIVRTFVVSTIWLIKTATEKIPSTLCTVLFYTGNQGFLDTTIIGWVKLQEFFDGYLVEKSEPKTGLLHWVRREYVAIRGERRRSPPGRYTGALFSFFSFKVYFESLVNIIPRLPTCIGYFFAYLKVASTSKSTYLNVGCNLLSKMVFSLVFIEIIS